jgi:alkylated DNA repair protein (DNA oxidative demethylase)
MIEGFRLLPEYFSPAAQRALVAEVLAGIESAPLYRPVMPRTGKPLSVMMTNFGSQGWISDRAGYRYQVHHPETGKLWPAIPQTLLDLWNDVSDYAAPPEACLVNWYASGARMGLHVDADEDAKDAPVVSVSLGDRALFRVGGPQRNDPTSSLRLASGDVVVLGGAARNAYHGIDRIYPGSSTLVPGGGRINLTLRRVTRPDA